MACNQATGADSERLTFVKTTAARTPSCGAQRQGLWRRAEVGCESMATDAKHAFSGPLRNTTRDAQIRSPLCDP